MAKVTEQKYDDYQKVNGNVIYTVVLASIILFLVCITKLNN